MITLYLAEDQSMLNTALSQLLNLEDNLEVLGSATNGKHALAEIQRLQPDVAILDIEMPMMSGLEVAEVLHDKQLATKVIILTTFAQKTYFEKAVEVEVAGYLLKDSPSDDLIETINKVMMGRTVYDPELVVTALSSNKNPLSKREMSVLKAAASGDATKVMAQKLFLSEGTVRNYLSAIFSKLGVHNRLEAIEVAKKNKWIN
ncbi:response regulator transcription factor [Pediococcus pentosaceus]|jgi:two-component system response regulator DesR|uniref:Transcriptional regulatory protein DesR n=1 Tax=Pediococcus pentosaceus TaxID=1255 RepID=A0A1Y0VRW4_PEDPE|nr:response regulator transcription factor [Pediococcus pentosaceus]ARW18876.1 Transcriptional regulatory protein DesR [Pediococcus pentosaceus]KAF0507379.1 response regulator [Pediococcus pentosaceus]MBF7121779.1 response regulator transcription factor [Pediococcus pentosaceus]MBF7139028.1 response regulator transcription factor [Pediococcus pentosaceus]MCI1284869.1 response regulator transcription factor [Pediococcus pentosaceus]